jgi:hypothetical protein
MAARVTREEHEFAKQFSDYALFVPAYVEKYKDTVPLRSISKRAYHIWDSRERHTVVFAKRDAEALEKAHTVLIPAVIKTKSQATHRSDPFPDIGEILVKCHNVLVEIASVQKEQLEIFKRLSEKKQG